MKSTIPFLVCFVSTFALGAADPAGLQGFDGDGQNWLRIQWSGPSAEAVVNNLGELTEELNCGSRKDFDGDDAGESCFLVVDGRGELTQKGPRAFLANTRHAEGESTVEISKDSITVLLSGNLKKYLKNSESITCHNNGCVVVFDHNGKLKKSVKTFVEVPRRVPGFESPRG